MLKISTILVDDERIGRSRLRRLLEKEPDLEIVAEYADGGAALEAMRETRPDLLFLDINMPVLDGFDVLEALGPEQQPPAVVFVTAYDEHAVRAFEACALDYVLKPASPERLAKTLERVRQRLSNRAAEPSPSSAPPPPPPRFTVRSGSRMSFVAPEEIDWVEAAGNYAILHVGGHNHMVRETMAGLEEQLAPLEFLRVSRSGIVNLRRVKELHSPAGGEPAALLHDGQRVPITRPVREVAERLTKL